MIIYTDASYSKNKNMSGLGIVFVQEDNGKSRISHFGTYSRVCRDNNTAEIAAIALVFDYLKERKCPIKLKQGEEITIVSDSQVALNKIHKMVFGSNDFERHCLRCIYDYCTYSGVKVVFRLCKGHCKDDSRDSYYNNMVDKLSNDYRKLGYSLYYSNRPIQNKNNQHIKE